MEDRELRTAAGVRRLDDELRATRAELAGLRRTVARIGVCLALGLVVAGLVVPLWSVPALHDSADLGDPGAGEAAPMRLLSGGVVMLGLADAGSTEGAPSSLGGVLAAVGGLLVVALLGVLLLVVVLVGVAADARRLPAVVGTAGVVGGLLGATCAVMLTIYAVAEEPSLGWGSPLLAAGVGLAVWLVRTPPCATPEHLRHRGARH